MNQITIRLSTQEKQTLARIAHESDLTISQILRSLIRKYLKEINDESSEHLHLVHCSCFLSFLPRFLRFASLNLVSIL